MGDKVKGLVIKVLECVNTPFYLVRVLFLIPVCLLIVLADLSANLTDEQLSRFGAAFVVEVWHFGIIGIVLFVLECKWCGTCFDEKVDEVVALSQKMEKK